MSRVRFFAKLLSVLLFASSLVAYGQQWLTGKLVDTERQEVQSGSTTTYNSDSKKKNGKYSENGTSRTTDDTDVYQVFTIQTADRTYVVRQKLNFPWSKPANITVGGDVKFSVQGNKVVIMDNDEKQQKASVVKATVNQ